jgi:hypothetical protein
MYIFGQIRGVPIPAFLKSRIRDTIYMVSRPSHPLRPRNAPYVGALRPLAP